MNAHIATNNRPRDLLSWYELTPKEQKEFDYIETPEDDGMDRFVRYRGWVYDTQDMMAVRKSTLPADSFLQKWDVYQGDSFFSGVLLKYCDNYERVIMATYNTDPKRRWVFVPTGKKRYEF